MAYDPNFQNFTPAGQAIGAIGGTLSQILGGYLGAKLEQDKTRREFDANKRIIKARYPGMTDQQLSEYAQIPSSQLSQMMQGLGAAEFQKVMRGPGAGMQQQQPQQEGYGFTPEALGVDPQQQQMMQMPEGQIQQVGEAIQQRPRAPRDDRMTRDDKIAITNELNDIADLETRLGSSNLSEQQYMQVAKHIADRKQIVQDTLLEDRKLQVSLDKLELDKRKDERDQIRLEEQLESGKTNRKMQQRKALNDLYYKDYAAMREHSADLERDLVILERMRDMNSDPNTDFGYQSLNAISNFFEKKLGFNLGSFLSLDAQEQKKLSADLYKRLPSKMKGEGRMTEQIFGEFTKALPNIDQSPEARARVLEYLIAQTKLDMQPYKIARGIRRKNNEQFVDGFFDKVEDKMEPYYKNYGNTVRKAAKKLEKNKTLQKKEEKFGQRATGSMVGGALGVLGGAGAGLLSGLAVGGVPGAIIGGTVGGIGSLGLGSGGMLGGEAVVREGQKLPEQLRSELQQLRQMLDSGHKPKSMFNPYGF